MLGIEGAIILFIVIFLILIIALPNLFKFATSPITLQEKIDCYFGKTTYVDRNYNFTLYSGTKNGKKFLIAIPEYYGEYEEDVSLSDINLLVNTAKEKHIPNKILITSIPLGDNIENSKLFKESQIRVLNAELLGDLINEEKSASKKSTVSHKSYSTPSSSSSNNSSSSTSDPIQSEASASHGILSIFKRNNNIDHL